MQSCPQFSFSKGSPARKGWSQPRPAHSPPCPCRLQTAPAGCPARAHCNPGASERAAHNHPRVLSPGYCFPREGVSVWQAAALGCLRGRGLCRISHGSSQPFQAPCHPCLPSCSWRSLPPSIDAPVIPRLKGKGQTQPGAEPRPSHSLALPRSRALCSEPCCSQFENQSAGARCGHCPLRSRGGFPETLSWEPRWHPAALQLRLSDRRELGSQPTSLRC